MMPDANGWTPWQLIAAALAPGSSALLIPKVWDKYRAWRGETTSARVAQERVELDERAQIAAERTAVAARADAAFARSDAEVARGLTVQAELRAEVALQTASGLHWYQVALAWCSRAWNKLPMARGLRDDVIEAREGWAEDRRGWFLEDPEGAGKARRPDWMGPPPDFVIVQPPEIPDPPKLEEI